MGYANLIGLSVHECAHLVYDGHGKDFMRTQDEIFDVVLKQLEDEVEEMKNGRC